MQHRRTVKLAGALAAAVLAAAPAAASARGIDFVDGWGQNVPLGTSVANTFTMTAFVTRSGHVHGTVSWQDAMGDHLNGTVTCLRVSGSYATLVMAIADRHNPRVNADHDAIWIHDGGSSSADRMRNTLFAAAQAPAMLRCDDPSKRAVRAFTDAANPLAFGAIQVHDG